MSSGLIPTTNVTEAVEKAYLIFIPQWSLFAYCEATVLRISVIVRKIYECGVMRLLNLKK